VHNQIKAGLHKISGHGLAHQTQPDEPDAFGHRFLLIFKGQSGGNNGCISSQIWARRRDFDTNRLALYVLVN
jgi:hypothetical protein